MVEARGHGTTREDPVAPEERAREALLMGLRLAEGIDEARFARRTGVAMDDAVDAGVLAQAIEEGYVAREGGRLVALAEGRLRLDAMLPVLLR
jgi:oxygen-independent coproporphyrinogen-3 oxidase